MENLFKNSDINNRTENDLDQHNRDLEELATETSRLQLALRDSERLRLCQDYSTSMVDLERSINETGQRDRLVRANSRAADSQLYLVDFTEVGGNFAITLKGTMIDGVRNTYTVRGEKVESGVKLHCSCPDSRSAGTRYNLVCKHRCFVVCRVAKMYPRYYFNDAAHVLKPVDADAIVLYLRNRSATENFYYKTPSPTSVPSTHFQCTPQGLIMNPDTDDCPICFSELTASLAKVECPSCYHRIHSDCMKIWCSVKKNCVLCRSDLWNKWTV